MKSSANLYRSITQVGVICSTLSLGAFLPSTVKAASITSITLGAETTVAASTTAGSFTYEGYSRSINSFVADGSTWAPINAAVNTTLILQRSNNAPTATDNNKQLVWERYSTSTTSLRGMKPTTTQAALQQNNIYLGTDNLFANRDNGSGNQSDVERADFVFSSGYLATADVGVTVFERGATNGHDAFAIAAITGFNASNQPIYGSLVGYTASSNWGTSALLSTSKGDILNNRILKKSSTDLNFVDSGGNNQNIGGELIRLTQLVSTNTAVYGYSLFAYDTFSAVANNTCTLAQLSSISNTNCYISNTGDTGSATGGANGGGLDLLAANLGVTARSGTTPQSVPTPEPLTVIGSILGGIAAFRLKRKLKR